MLQANTFNVLLNKAESSLSQVEKTEIKWIKSQKKITSKKVLKAIKNIIMAKNTFNQYIESVFKKSFSSWASLKEIESSDLANDQKEFKENKRISREHINKIRKKHDTKIYNIFKYFCSLYIGERKVIGFKELFATVFNTKTISINRCEYVLTYLKNYLNSMRQAKFSNETQITVV